MTRRRKPPLVVSVEDKQVRCICGTVGRNKASTVYKMVNDLGVLPTDANRKYAMPNQTENLSFLVAYYQSGTICTLFQIQSHPVKIHASLREQGDP